MRKKFCPKCGKNDVDFYKGFCLDCFEKKNVNIIAPKSIPLSVCKKCDLWLVKNKWVKPHVEKINNLIIPKVKTNLYKFKVKTNVEDDFVLVIVTGFLDENHLFEITKEIRIPISIRTRTCDNCSKISSKYYEAKIQLRKINKKESSKYKKIDEFIMQQMKKLKKTYPEAKIFWIKREKEGLDFYFGSMKIIELVLKKVHNKFKLKSVHTAKYAGLNKKTQKKRHRHTFLIRV